MGGYGGFERFILLGLLVTFIFKIIHHSTKGVVLDMTLMITIAIIGFLLFVIICFINNVYPHHVKFEIGVKGLKLEFKTKEKGSHPAKD